MDRVALVRRYYDALDEHDYAALESILAPEFRQRRPDRTFEGREAFVRFMREERPNPDTTHELEAVIGEDGRVAARGRVLDGDRVLFAFADFFELDAGRIVALETYSR
ncbi:nuclear transport factor 2 family protein [Halopiger goleimassiliensis]|uniref:nuclear transport factor 2 family protein n=1 Tax=Halopiger goleimassiliensis TaxID=1293048 RepID=UPI0006779859|nr:nuclear transport factor 2 family protein [Halopiger goleimassiliensis]